MKVYRAETGKMVAIPSLQGVDSLDALKFELEHATQVPATSQILMTSFGTQLKEEMVTDAVQATEKDEYIVIVYDRHYLDAPAESIAALTESESPDMEPQITLPNGSSLAALRTKRATSKLTLQQHCELYLSLFRGHEALSQTYVQTTTSHYHLASNLASEQRIQSMALTVAQSNLDAHVSSAAQTHDAFTAVAGREFARQAVNLAGADADVEALRRVRVHHGMLEAMTMDGKKAEAKEGAVLAEFVDLREVMEARERAEEQYETLVAQTKELRERLGGIQQGAEGLRKQGTGDVDLNSVDAVVAEVKDALTRVTGIREKIQRDLTRVQDKISELLPSTSSPSTLPSTSPPGVAAFSAPAHLPSHARKTFEAFDHLAEIHVRDYLPELATGEAQAREGVLYLTKSKARMIDVFARQMNAVSQLQSAIAGVVPRLRGLEQGVKALRKEVEEGALGGVKRVVAAYGALMIELVRRKEYANILLENATILADLLGHFRAQEQRRREAFRSDLSKALPFGINGIEDSPPYTEISTPGLRDRLPEVKKEEVRDFLAFLRTTYATATTAPASLALEPVSMSLRRLSSDRGRSMSRGSSGGAPVPAQQQLQLPESGARDKILQALGKMNRQIDGMRAEFVRGVEKKYFPDRLLPNRTISADDYSGSRRDSYLIREAVGDALQASAQPLSPLREDIEGDALLMQKSKALETAEERIKNYESRIKSLEETLQRTYRVSSQQLRPPSPSISSSVYSVVDVAEDANGKVDLTAKAETWRIRCAELERRVEELQRERERDHAEIDERLAGERVKADELQLLLEEERRAAREEKEAAAREWEERVREWEDKAKEWVVVADQTEQVKEDLRAQILELEGLLDEERQVYEENRMSLLREAQTQAHLAERRIADVEIEWKDRIAELEQALDRQQNENTQRTTQYEQRLRSQREEYERALAAQQERMKLQSEETHRESERVWKGKVAEQATEMEDARKIWAEERENLVAQLEGLRLGMSNSEEAREDIKQRLAQAREMAAHAEKDWMEKNEALLKMTAEFEESRRLALDCLRLIETPGTPAEDRAQGQDNMSDVLHKLMGNITRVTAARDGLEQSLNVSHDHVKELELDLVAERERTADEARRRTEAEALVTDLAAQLQSYHSGVADGLIKGLRLEIEVEAPLEATVEAQAEAESTDWTPRAILEVAKKVDIGEVIKKVRGKMIERQEALKKWDKAYKGLKEKYAEASDKIAFRNFKVNDVALFLPTRNSTGKPWAAFNIHAPHYFLKPTDRVSDQLATREWIVARIASMTECVVDSKTPDSNPYGLADGIKFYQLEGEPWADKAHKSSRNRSSSSRDDAQLSPSSSTTFKRSSVNTNLLSNSAMMSASGVMNQSQVDALQRDAPALAGSIIGSGGLPSPTSTSSTIGHASTISIATNAGSPNMPHDSVAAALRFTPIPPPQSRMSSGAASGVSPTSPTHPFILSAATPPSAKHFNVTNNRSLTSRTLSSTPVQREGTPPTSRYDRGSPSPASSGFLERERIDPTNWTNDSSVL